MAAEFERLSEKSEGVESNFARAEAEWSGELAKSVREFADFAEQFTELALAYWYDLAPERRSSLIERAVRLDGFAVTASETLARIRATRPMSGIDRVYEKDVARFVAAVARLKAATALRNSEESRRAEELHGFIASRPGYMEGVERSRSQLAEGKFTSFTADALTERIQNRKSRE